MTKQELIEGFGQNHQSLIHYIDTLTPGEFTYSHHEKWTAGQQLRHIYLCLQPITKALASKDHIAQTFGQTDHPPMAYDTVIDHYRSALDRGGKAPDRFVPGQLAPGDKAGLIADLSAILQTIQQQLEGYTDEELDMLVLPHPLLGKLTIREMFYLMTYHATHHHRQTEQNLTGFAGH